MVLAKEIGDLNLFLEDRYIILTNVLYIPSMKRNLISISCILEQEYRISFEITEAFIFFKDIQVCFTILENDLYKLTNQRKFCLIY